jgi:hypothetical protein
MTDYPLKINPVTGTVSIPASSGGSRGLEAVADLGLDPSGQEDCAPALGDFLNSDAAAGSELHFPPGQYRFNSTVETNAKNVKLVGDAHLANMGNSPVVLFTDQEIDAILWWNGSKTNSNMNGPRLDYLQFQDRSAGNNVLRSAVKLTATANMELKIGFQYLVPRRYDDGTVKVDTGSSMVTGSNTQWDECMTPCGWLVIDGYPYEILTVDSPTSLTLAIDYQGPNGSGKKYAINWGGVGVHLDPGTDFSQYGKEWSLNGRCGCALFASSGSTSPKYTGTSRIKVLSGYLNGEGIPDSIAGYFGPYSDTFVWDVAMNSYAFGLVVANGHQHDLQHGDYENAGGPPPVTGRPVEYASCHGILVMSDNSSDTWGNRLGGYFRQCGTAIELYGQPGKAPKFTVIGVSTFRSNKADFINGNATETQVLMPHLN